LSFSAHRADNNTWTPAVNQYNQALDGKEFMQIGQASDSAPTLNNVALKLDENDNKKGKVTNDIVTLVLLRIRD
jgi:hypothetical protein